MLPIRTSIRPYKTPYANYALIVANVIVFLLTYSAQRNPYTGSVAILRPWAEQFMLTPARPLLWQFVTYAFLHAGLLHIGGNMFFLYIFGNNVNDRLGHIGYICFYLAGAVFSAAGHTLISSNPVLGASGAVAAVTGAYLVLFPKTLITVLYWFFIIGTIDIPAIWFIAIKLIIIDNAITQYTPQVAHGAHLAGYAFGITATLLLLSTGLLTSTSTDLWAMIKQWNRRRQYRDVVSTGYDPYTGLGPTKRIKARQIEKSGAQLQKQQQVERFRADIAAQIAQRNLPAAAAQYLELAAIDPDQVLPRQYLLDIANQLAGEGRYEQAAAAYEKFIAHYSNYEYIEQVRLMLGIIYARYLEKPHAARELLQEAAKRLSDPGQVELCQQELKKLARK